MRITRLRLTDFKTHEDLEIEPAAGLTVIRGPNEAGKSTIQQAIELALFRKPDANREDIRRAWAWGASEPPTVELDFEVDDISATLRKRFGGSRSEGELTLGGEVIGDYALIGDKVAELTGVPTESFFRATASVGHAELDAVGRDEPAIGDRLQKAISGADRGTAKAKKKLEAAVHRYRTQGHKNPGLLKVARNEVEALQRELTDGEAALVRLQADRAQWVEAAERREELDRKLSRQQADLSEAQRAEELAKQRDAAQERYDRLRRAVELIEQDDEIRAEMPTSLSPEELRTSVARAQNIELELSELQAEIDAAADAAASAGPDLVPPRPMRWLGAGALLVLIGWLAMFLLRDAGVVAFVLVAAIAAGVVLTLVQAFRMARKRRRYGLAMQLAETEISAHQEHARDRQEAYRRRRRELDGHLEALGLDNVRAAEAVLATTEEHAGALAKIDGELQGLGVEDRNYRRLAEARDQAAGEAAQAKHALAAMGSLGQDPARARAEAQRQVAQTTPARDAARSEADQAEGRVGANAVDAELVASLAERLAASNERLAELERRALIYEGTLAAIEAAETATLKTAARYLEERMGPAIAGITDGRYDDIEVDEKSLAFKVRAPESGELVDVAQLSQGTADQLFLAARLGLVRLVTLDRRPPLILDDPLVTFDAKRGERALRLIKQLAHEHDLQVLYLTCADRFDALADKLVVLPGPSSERVLAHPRRSREPEAVTVSARPSTMPEPTTSPELPGEASEPVTTSAGPDRTPQPTLRFAPDPRPNPNPVAPRRTTSDEPTTAPLFPDSSEDEHEATVRQAGLRTARAAEADEAEHDPLESLRRSVHDTGEADPFRLDPDGGREDRA